MSSGLTAFWTSYYNGWWKKLVMLEGKHGNKLKNCCMTYFWAYIPLFQSHPIWSLSYIVYCKYIMTYLRIIVLLGGGILYQLAQNFNLLRAFVELFLFLHSWHVWHYNAFLSQQQSLLLWSPGGLAVRWHGLCPALTTNSKEMLHVANSVDLGELYAFCINMGCFTSKCIHKTWFQCVQTALKQGDAIWLTAQFETHVTLCKGFVNEMDVQSLQSLVCCHSAIQHNPSANQAL